MAEANARVLFILKDTKDYFRKMKNTFISILYGYSFVAALPKMTSRVFQCYNTQLYTSPHLCV